MLKRILITLALLVVLLLPVGNSTPAKAATNYYGTICIWAGNGRFLAPNNVYYLAGATDPYCNAQSELRVYRISASVFAFYSPYTGYLYTKPDVPCVWWCDDAGAILYPYGYYIIHCKPYAPGWFSVYSLQMRRWAELYRLPTGALAPAFLSAYDPTARYVPNGLFFARLGGGWCGA